MTLAKNPVTGDVSKNSMKDVVMRTSSRSATNAKSAHTVRRMKKRDHQQRNDADRELTPDSSRTDSSLAQDQFELDQSDLERLKGLPKEVGVMLIAAGVVGLILPGPGTPALIAGGLALWPGAFSKLELWLERRYPVVHEKSMRQIGRFLADLEKRYPYSR
jgi:hypothetical protein